MAKGSRDVILRDRLEFDVDVNGDTSLVYGRIDLSDYVSIVKNEGLAIKEIRFMMRDPTQALGQWPAWMGPSAANVPNFISGGLKVFATTTAYEDVADVGIASPNVICVYEEKYYAISDNGTNYADTGVQFHFFGTPDLHPEGYDVVTDLLIGVAAGNLLNSELTDTKLEIDVMIIAEPKKITSKDLTQMLSQAQDL